MKLTAKFWEGLESSQMQALTVAPTRESIESLEEPGEPLSDMVTQSIGLGGEGSYLRHRDVDYLLCDFRKQPS